MPALGKFTLFRWVFFLILMSLFEGPGPGAYLLPPTVGFKGHDPSKYRNPMYSMSGSKKGFVGKTLGPGPTYLVTGYDEHGQITAPGYTIKSRPKDLSNLRRILIASELNLNLQKSSSLPAQERTR